MNNIGVISKKFYILLIQGMIFFFSLTGHTMPNSEGPFSSSHSLWALNPSTLAGLGGIPTISESQSANEKRIIQIIQLAEDGDLMAATQQAKYLIEAAPNYALAQLIYADLLSLHIPKNFEHLRPENSKTQGLDLSPQVLASSPAILAAQQELSLRLKASTVEPPKNSLPKHIISIGNQYRQLLVADTKLGRVFVFNIQHTKKSPILELKNSFFMTIGDQGAGKMVEGDKKTPLGIYQLLNRVPQNLLTDLYGLGAIQTNYPNPVDRLLGKTGYGIWLHGTPSQVYVRYPLASDGCLVVSNDDMTSILSSTTPLKTLVIIDHGIDWVQPISNLSNNIHHPVYKKLTEALQRSSSDSMDIDLNLLYVGGSKWEYRLLRLIQTNESTKRNFKINNVSLIEWSKDHPYVMTEFDFKFNPESKIHRVRQYWMVNQDNWQIVRESIF